MDIILWVLVIIGVLAVLLAAWRFFMVRSRGTVVVLRELPSTGTRGWRHGTLQYNGDDLQYYKLRSLSPGPDHVFNRSSAVFRGHRKLVDDESSFMLDANRVIEVEAAGTGFEFVLDPRSAMALISWIESAPSERQERIDRRKLQHKADRTRKGR